ncbi:nucleotidyltransferase family protein [Rhodovibrionaceae bacterium A322]
MSQTLFNGREDLPEQKQRTERFTSSRLHPESTDWPLSRSEDPSQESNWLSCWHYLAARLRQTGFQQNPSTETGSGTETETTDNQPPPPGLALFAQRLSEFTGAALAHQLLGAQSGLSQEEVTQSRLLNRYHHQRQKDCLLLINSAGLDAVAIKGFAMAHQLFQDPDVRITGDLDLVIRPADLPAFLDLFRSHGFEFRPLPAKPWGFISEASFQPLASEDGVVNIDLHVAPDCFPAYRSLTTERLFAQAVPFAKDLPHIKLAHPSHGYFLLASNAAKDKFGPFAVKKVLDALVIDASVRIDLSQSEISQLVREGQLQRPFEVFQALLNWLRTGETPHSLSNLQRREFARVQTDWMGLFPQVREGKETEASAWAQLRREFLLCTEAPVFFNNNARRLKGLFFPASGVPKL